MTDKYEFSEQLYKTLASFQSALYKESLIEGMPEQKDITVYTAEGVELMTISYKINKDIIKLHTKVWDYSKEPHTQYLNAKDFLI